MFLVGDIGGTRSRFYAIDNEKLVFEHVYASKEHACFIAMLEDFLKNSKMKFSACVFGIAGAVIGGRCKTTNLPWEVSVDEIKKTAETQDVYLMNDLELLSYALVNLNRNMVETVNACDKRPGPMLLVCPGTGLGVACITNNKKPIAVLPTEAGHADFAPVDKLELDLLTHYIDKFGHVSTERFVSGSGLVNVYLFLCKRNLQQVKYKTSEEIVEAATSDKDKMALETCLMFLDMFASTLGNLALNYIPYGGIYVSGALTRKLYLLIDKDRFLQRMANKGRFAYLIKQLPLFFIKEQKLAICGALVFIQNIKGKNHGDC